MGVSGYVRAARVARAGVSAKFAGRLMLPVAALLVLQACAPIVGSPHPVVKPSDMRATVARYPYDASLAAFYGTSAQRGGLTRRDYRDMVLAIYLGAIDVEYYKFRQDLAASGRGTALGMDLLVLGLSGATALASADDFEDWAVAATMAGGARAVVDKNLFFDRTLPSVISAMDAERARVRTSIEQKLDLDEARYPLPAVFNDISSYQLAGTLERGMQRVAAIASADAAEAQADLDRAVSACEQVDDLAEENRRLTLALRDPADGTYFAEANDIALRELGIEVEEGATSAVKYAAIQSYLNRAACSKSERKAAVDRVLAAIEAAEEEPDDGSGE